MLVDGQSIARQVLENVHAQTHGLYLHLAAVLVGDDKGLGEFVNIKKKAAEFAGITFSSYDLRGQATSRQVIEAIQYLNNDESVHGIFVELPLPGTIPRDSVLSVIAPEKDVDVLSPAMQKKFYADECPILPPSVRALEIVFQEHNIVSKDKTVAIFGLGFLVGKPIMHWLEHNGARVLAIDIDTKEPEKISRKADIIISGVGKAGLVKADMVKKDAVVVDYGYNKKGGDVDFDSVSKKASIITPVPGGMGPLVVAAVLENLVTLATDSVKNVKASQLK